MQNSKEDQKKLAKLQIPQLTWFWPVVEYAYNSQNAQFGLMGLLV